MSCFRAMLEAISDCHSHPVGSLNLTPSVVSVRSVLAGACPKALPARTKPRKNADVLERVMVPFLVNRAAVLLQSYRMEDATGPRPSTIRKRTAERSR